MNLLRLVATVLLALTLPAGAAEVAATFASAATVPVTAAGYSATGNTVHPALNFTPPTGTSLTVVSNTGLGFMDGTFSNLAQGQTVELPYAGITYRFVANYYGGSGNDLVLQWAAVRPYAWGDAAILGNGGTTESLVPTPVSVAGVLAGQSVVSLAAGRSHSLALCADGTLAAWGVNQDGQLGDGSRTNRTLPVAVTTAGVLAGKRIVAVAGGAYHSLALCSDGTVATWGDNEWGQLGDGTTTARNVPVAVDATGVLVGKSVVAVAGGYFHSLVLCSDGTLAAWGYNVNGQLGNGGTVNSKVPVLVNLTGVLAGKAVVAVSCGSSANYALGADGSLFSWGANGSGQLGNGTTALSNVPVAVSAMGALAGKTVAAVAGGGNHALALCSDATLVAWGDNYNGGLGNGSTANSKLPVAVNVAGTLAEKAVVEILGGGNHSQVLCADGSVAAWGWNYYGQLGDLSKTNRSLPVGVNTDLVAPGGRFIAGVKSQSTNHGIGLVALPAAPRLVVEQPAGTGLRSGRGTVDFGSASAGAAVVKTFTIRNIGIIPLAIQGVSIDGPDAAAFVLSNPPAPAVAAGASTTFEVTFTGAGAGFGRKAALHLASDDPSGGVFDLDLTATVAGVLAAGYESEAATPLTIATFTATGSRVELSLNFAPAIGTSLTVVENTGLDFIHGTFDNLAQGQSVVLDFGGVPYRFVANYYGGSGNDLVLQWAANRVFGWGANADGQCGTGNRSAISQPVPVAAAGALAGKTVLALATGGSHSLALCADGTLAVWGANESGQLGINSTTASTVPVAVPTVGVLAGRTIIAIAAGLSHSLALCADGTLAAWGGNAYGQLGNGSLANSGVPVAVNASGVLAGKSAVAITVGYHHSLALCADGTVVTWGQNNSGQLGTGNTLQSTLPVAVNQAGVLAGKTVVALAAGGSFSVVRCTDGSMAAWGANSNGQLGNGGAVASALPVVVNTAGALAGKAVVAVDAGAGYSLGLGGDGTLIAWGYNYSGQLGNGTTTSSDLPVAVSTAGVLAGRTVVGIDAGGGHGFALCSDGTLAAWGDNSSGELGNGSKVQSNLPVVVATTHLAAGERFVLTASGPSASHTLGLVAGPAVPRMVVEQANGVRLRDDGSTVDFGSAAAGASLTRTCTIRNTGIVPLVLGEVTTSGTHAADFVVAQPANSSVAAGSSTTFTVTFTAAGVGFSRTAELRITGNDPMVSALHVDLTATVAGMLTAAFGSDSEVPLTVAGFTAAGSSVALALNHAPATGATLTVVSKTGLGFISGTFDNLAQGQLVTLGFGGVNYQFVANYYGGSGNDLVLQWAATRPVAWGKNGASQLGNGGTTDSSTPGPVSTAGVLAGKTIIAMAAGDMHSLALCADGTLAAWGYNSDGRLGNNSTVSSSVPLAVNRAGVLAGKTVVAVAAGNYHSLALCADGTLAAWGGGNSGVLGNGSPSYSTVPVAVNLTALGPVKPVVAIACGASHNLALCVDGTVLAWGSNLRGELGDGSATSSNFPVVVDTTGVFGGRAVVGVAAGSNHSLAWCADGTMAAWGYNSDGQLGDGSKTQRLQPVAVNTTGVLAGKQVIAVTAGGSHSLARCADGTLVGWGYNGDGQLGNGGTYPNNVPMAMSLTGVLAGRTISAVSGGGSHSLVQCADGTLAACGYNYFGQVGDRTTLSRDLPVVVSTATLAAGETFVMGVSGPVASHSLGLVAQPFIPRLVLEQPAGGKLASGRTAVDFGSCAAGSGIARSFTVRNQGLVPLLITGVTVTGANVADFAVTTAPAATVAAGGATTVVVTFTAGGGFQRSATLHVASNDPRTGDFQIELGATVSGTLVAGFASGADVPVSAAGFTATGSSVAFNLNYAPATGTTLTVVDNTGLGFIKGTFTNLAHGQVVTLPFGGVAYRFVANYYGGSGNDLVLQWAANRLFAWGSNFSGQLADGTTTSNDLPKPLGNPGVLAGKTILAGAVGYGFNLVLAADGTLAAWGENGDGQLGNGGTVDSKVPVAVNQTGALAGKMVVAVAAGYDRCLVLCGDGTLATWGKGTTNKMPELVSQTGALAGKSVIAIAAGHDHYLALCDDGTVAAWGGNDSGQLGNGSRGWPGLPVAVDTLGVLADKQVTAIAAGSYFSLVRCADGTLAAWGSNTWGRLGADWGPYSTNLPVAVSTAGVLAGKTVVALAAGNSHALALCADGVLVAWGFNSSGQLGNGSTTDSSVPVSVNQTGVLAGKTVVRVAAGYEHSWVRCADGTLAAWGHNSDLVLGNGSFNSSSLPVTVNTGGLASGERFSAQFSGHYATHNLALVAMPFIPRIAVESPAGSPVAKRGGTVDFGAVAVGNAITRGFTIRNLGLEPLVISSATLAGPDTAEFTIAGPAVNTVAAGSSTTFEVTFTATTGFARSAVLRLVSNDPEAGLIEIQLAATVRGGLNVVYATGTEIPVSAAAFTATGSTVNLSLAHAPATGSPLMVVRNSGLGFISGEFINLAQGQVVELGHAGNTYKFAANYYGGSGNDLVLEWAANRAFGWGVNTSGQLGTGTTTPSKLPIEVTTTGVLNGKTISALAAGKSHSLALGSDGTLAAWGGNGYGQLGIGNNTDSKVPVAVSTAGVLNGKRVVAVAAGSYHNLALCADGTLAAWGYNSDGVLGDGTTTNRNLPVAVDTTGVLAGKKVVAVAAGGGHSLALCSDGTVAAWGANPYGGLGDGSTRARSRPVAVSVAGALAGKRVVAIAAGVAHSLAVCADGSVVAWGRNSDGQLGDGGTMDSSKVPVAVETAGFLNGRTVVAVAAGAYHSLAWCSDGMLAAWGYNGGGQLGNGNQTQSNLPVAVNISGVLAGKSLGGVSAGNNSSIARGADGTVAAWGDNSYGQLGDNSTNTRLTPVAVDTSAMAPGWRLMAGISGQGADHTLGLVALPFIPRVVVEQPVGTVLANGSGKVDFESAAVNAATAKVFTIRNRGVEPLVLGEVSISGPQAAEFVLTTPPAATVAPGESTTLVVTFTAGAGFNRRADLRLTANDPYAGEVHLGLTAAGNGTLEAAYGSGGDVPLTVAGFQATGSTVNFALNFAPIPGTALTVVRNTGTGFIQGVFTNLSQGGEVMLSHGGRSYRFVANYYGGSGNDLVLLWAAVHPVAWGRNSSGQLGIGGSAQSNFPAAVDMTGVFVGKRMVAAAASRNHSLALCADGTLAGWGSNLNGELGTGTTASSQTPVAAGVGGALAGRTVVAIATGSFFSLALGADGVVAAWGSNSSGQLGNGGYTTSTVPVAVSTTGALAGKAVVAIAAGYAHCLALCADGTLAAWGSNADGQLGFGNYTDRNVPGLVYTAGVLAGKTVVAVAAGNSHSLALCADGTLVAWGSNAAGKLGNGNTLSSAVPVAVSTAGVLAGKPVVAMAAGERHSLALCADGTLAAWGSNTNGELGNGTTASSSVPVAVVADGALAGKTPVALTAGYSHSLVLCSDGTLVAWGYNFYGQLGNGSRSNSLVPMAVSRGSLLDGDGFIAATSGGSAYHSLGLVASPPVRFAGYAISTPFQTAVTVSLAKLLAEAADPDGDSIAVTAAGPASAQGGTAVLQGVGILYTPATGFSGTDSFSVTLADAGGASVVGTVTVTVGPDPSAGGVGVNPPVLTVLPGGKLGLAFQGIPGRSYIVQRSVSGLDNWGTLATIPADASGKVAYTDESPPAGSAFYRLGLP